MQNMSASWEAYEPGDVVSGGGLVRVARASGRRGFFNFFRREERLFARSRRKGQWRRHSCAQCPEGDDCEDRGRGKAGAADTRYAIRGKLLGTSARWELQDLRAVQLRKG